MIRDAAITRPVCGASTPLPSDLRTPTFPCRFCNANLETAAITGDSLRSADAVVGHIQSLAASPRAGAKAPQFIDGNTGFHPDSCKRCGKAVSVPLDLHIHSVRCDACGSTQPVAAYLSDWKRLDLEMARQAGNESLRRLQREGIRCGKCGGTNAVPDDGRVQVECQFCHAAILLSEFVDETALARNRLKHGVFQVRDDLYRQHRVQQRRQTRLVVGGVIAAFLLVGAALGAASLLAP